MRKVLLLICIICDALLSTPVLAHQDDIFKPLEFIRNRGQWEEDFSYKAKIGSNVLYLENGCLTYVLADANNLTLLDNYKHGKTGLPFITLSYHAYKVRFKDANSKPIIKGNKPLQHYYNYYLGNDPTRWQSGIFPETEVVYENLYDQVDLKLYSNNGELKYDFIVQPGGDPTTIKLQFEGVDQLKIDEGGNLVISTSVGDVRELNPYVYQLINGEKRLVEASYKLTKHSLSYQIKGNYDPNYELYIDPTVVFASFSGSTADNWGFTATYDHSGNFYGGGIVFGTGYPLSTGAFQSTFQGAGTGGGNGFQGYDVSLTKFTSTGNTILFSTYLGGRDNEQPISMVVNDNNELVVAGRTYSQNFPVTPNAYQGSIRGQGDIFLIKFNPAGTAALASTYLGGTKEDACNYTANYDTVGKLKYSYADDSRGEVLMDAQNNIYFITSSMSSDIPVTTNAISKTLKGRQDAYYCKLDSNLSTLIYATFLGGSDDDAGYSIAFGPSESFVFLAGGTMSIDFNTTPNTISPFYNGDIDGFVVRIDNTTSYNLLNGTYIGTSRYEQTFGVESDTNGNAYIIGNTLGSNYPVVNATFVNPNSSQYITKLNPTLSTIMYSTVFGNGQTAHINITPVAFMVDICENVYVSGWGSPTVGKNRSNNSNLPITPDAIQTASSGGEGFYYFVLARDASAQLFGSYFSSNVSMDHVDGGTSRFDKNGIIYQGICGGCGNTTFPTTPGVYSSSRRSSNCNFLAVKISFDLGPTIAVATANPDTVGCPPFDVKFISNSVNATKFYWDFGDGDTSTSEHPNKRYTQPGIYRVKLIVENPQACIPIDSTFINIHVLTENIKADFDVNIVDTCNNMSVDFDNTSIFSNTPGSQNYTQFYWDFGDGTTATGSVVPRKYYSQPATYTVRLVMVDSTACNSPDTVYKTVSFDSSFVTAKANVYDTVCVGQDIGLINESINVVNYYWDFGNGQTSTLAHPTIIYTKLGTYVLRLIVHNPNTCNLYDTFTKMITVVGAPKADFEYSPNPPIPNSPITFINKSTDAQSYYWDFGDGNNSVLESPSHLYRKSGNYTICLQANGYGTCIDRYCRPLMAEVITAVDVPNAFTPNGDGTNDVLYVRGVGVEELEFKVYNRWGQLVFETTDIRQGWDGTFKGKEQEMESYGYTLMVTFIDGSKIKKQGNITLLR